MNTYIFWTRTAAFEAESKQVPFKWIGSFGEGERRLEAIGRRISSWYVTNGQQPPGTQDLNLVALGK